MRVRASEIVVGDLATLRSANGTPYAAPVQRTIASRSGGTVTLVGPRGDARLSRTYRAGTLVTVQRSQRAEQA